MTSTTTATATATDTATVKPTFDYHPTSYKYIKSLYYYNHVTEDMIKSVTLQYRSAIKRGYVRNGVMFHCRQNCTGDRYLWKHEATAIFNYIRAARREGRDVVAVTHGMSHPLPDTVCTYIYERKV